MQRLRRQMEQRPIFYNILGAALDRYESIADLLETLR